MVDINTMKQNVANIPQALQDIGGWCGFYVGDNGDIVKKPISIKDFKGVGVTNTNRLVDFQTAAKSVIDGKFGAIGIALKQSCGYTCIDVDCHERNKQSKYEEIKADLLNIFNTYSETSISGNGTHIFIKAIKPQGYKHTDKFNIIEIHNADRFIIVTGDIIEGKPTDITDCQAELNAVCEKHLIKVGARTGSIGQNLYDIEDEQVLEKISTFKKGALFLNGDWRKIERWNKEDKTYIRAYSSQSEADFGFISQILYVNGNSPEQAERLFKRSALYRRSEKSEGYVRHQITEASLRLTSVYDWKKVNADTLEAEADADSEILNITDKTQNFLSIIRQYGFQNCKSKKLNGFMTKYILNYGIGYKDIISTLQGDYDNATNGWRLFLINKDNLIYNDNGKEWLKWTGKFWQRCYDVDLLEYTAVVFDNLKHEAYQVAYSSLFEMDEDRKKELEQQAEYIFAYASTTKNRRNCLEMVDFSKSFFIKYGKLKFSENFNALNLTNGTYDFDKMQLFPHAKEYYQTKIADIIYNETAKCPIWEKALQRLVPNDDIRLYLQKAVGYTISNRSKEKALFILHGEGNNGKTTFINVILKIMGDYGVVVNPQTIMENFNNRNNGPRPDLLRLRDKRFAAVSESEENDKLGEGLIKSLTGGGYISCRGLHKEPVEFPATFKLWFDTNHKPQVRGSTLLDFGYKDDEELEF